jgi:hypothetical protein
MREPGTFNPGFFLIVIISCFSSIGVGWNNLNNNYLEGGTSMTVKKLKDVQVGSIIPVGGAKYKVVRNLHDNLHVVKQVAPAIYEQAERGLSGLRAESLNPNSLVWVDSEPAKEVKPSLTDSLRQQVKQQELTASLKAQIEDEEDEDDWDDIDDYYDDEEEEDDDYYPEYDYYTPNYHSHTHVAAVDGATKETATKASLRAQVAQQGALNASVRAQQAQTGVQNIGEELARLRNETQHGFGQVEENFEAVQSWGRQVADNFNGFAEQVEGEVQGLDSRVSKIENKIREEERKMNLQQQLNARLAAQKNQNALQAQLDAKLQQNKKSIGGNGTMKNILGAFTGQFGKVEGKFAFSPATNGLAIRKGISNQFVAFDGTTITDVQDFVLKFDVPAFSLPTAAAEVKKGDIVRNGADYGYVTRVNDGFVEVVNVEKNARGSVLPTKNILFGQSFYTVVKTLDAAGQGGFDPMLLLALGKGDTDELLPFLLMSGGLGGDAGAINPMMLMALKDKTSDLLPFLLMQQGGVMGEGFNPLMLLALGDDKGSKDLLPFLMMQGQGGAAQGGFNPMMLALLGDGELDMTTLALMGGLGGQGFGGGLFGGQKPATTPATETQGE